MRLPDVEKALAASWSEAALDAVKLAFTGLIADVHGSAAYRANLIGVMARRAIAGAG
jgi:carbon-monoxide dehydrogenase medium subunit